MLKKVIDTNIFIDRLADQSRFEDLFLTSGQVYMSSVVLMELRAGCHSVQALKFYHELSTFFRKVNRVITPTTKDYEVSGEILAKLQRVKGYEIRKMASITNDCLIAASARAFGATVYTQNRPDFVAIKDVFNFELFLA